MKVPHTFAYKNPIHWSEKHHFLLSALLGANGAVPEIGSFTGV